ncbi:hypothetical protein AB0N38_14180 [Micromonospora aurantiaca]|uniref:hypothetical protein n=1 Tax=Micromonospora aurantiaca (nom. illeg.) TaxID=47850 RepID=UPI003440FBE3
MSGNGRSTGHRTYRTNKAAMLAEPGGDICAICGHGGAKTTDHIISHKQWPRGPDGKLLPGFNARSNLQPAHGTMGDKAPPNRCPVCHRLCNQSKGDGTRTTIRSPRSRQW